MNIGTGIFAGGLCIAFVVLFIATKDRWNWRKVAVRSLAAVICLAAIGWVSQWAWTRYSERPVKQSELWGVAIGDTWQDVRFKKGMPTGQDASSAPDMYYDYVSDEQATHIAFKDGKVRGLYILSTKEKMPDFDLQGIQFGATSAQLMERFGTDAKVIISKDGLRRKYAYPQYQIFFGLTHDKIEVIGAYNNSFDVPLEFSAETEKQ